MTQFLQSKRDIIDWLQKHDIENYSVQEDLSVSVFGNLSLSESFEESQEILEYLPIQFDMVSGDCNFNNIGLLSLVGSPRKVKGSFSCTNNGLVSLEGAPRSVGESFWCGQNNLTSLVGSPEYVGHSYGCSDNLLETLHGVTQCIEGSFYCQENQLTNLVGGPRQVEGEYCCSRNQLVSLEGLYADMHIALVCQDNAKLTSLDSLPRFDNLEPFFIFDRTNFVELEHFYRTQQNDKALECSIPFHVIETYRQAWNDKNMLEAVLPTGNTNESNLRHKTAHKI